MRIRYQPSHAIGVARHFAIAMAFFMVFLASSRSQSKLMKFFGVLLVIGLATVGFAEGLNKVMAPEETTEPSTATYTNSTCTCPQEQ